MKVVRIASAICCLAILLPLQTRSQEDKVITKTVPISRNGVVRIDTYKGSVWVSVWDRDEVRIEATIEPDGKSNRDLENVQDTRIRIDENSGVVAIESDYSRLHRRRSWIFGWFGDDGPLPFVHYRITMPAQAGLKIKDYKSDINVDSLLGDAVLNTYRGSVNMRNCTGELSLETYRGDADISYPRFLHSAHIETYKGRIVTTLPQDAGFDLDTDLGRRADLDSDFPEIRNGHHRGQVNGGGPVFSIDSEKGNIRIVARQD